MRNPWTGTLERASSKPVEPESLTASDRCDRCGAQAYIRATPATGGELLFCVHHAKEYRPALEARGATFHDESDRLIESESNSADLRL